MENSVVTSTAAGLTDGVNANAGCIMAITFATPNAPPIPNKIPTTPPISVMTVSYTHLDVYKRQVQDYG